MPLELGFIFQCIFKSWSRKYKELQERKAVTYIETQLQTFLVFKKNVAKDFCEIKRNVLPLKL